ncbi:MAG: AAA family ATPase [Chloroflexi bacterium]|nr:AAA family ATPase [Chloroflexota bacterium]
MDEQDSFAIRLLETGVPGLDAVLGGGLPEYSFNIIAGPPGSGKTTLAQQMLFSAASPESPAICFTILGEPPVKMLRYQQQFGFFDASKVGESLRFVNLAAEVLEQGLGAVLDSIIQEVESTSPSTVVVDSIRSIWQRAVGAADGQMQMDEFVHRLAHQLTGWQATTFLIDEHSNVGAETDPVFTVADGIIALVQSEERNSVVRKLQVVKMRGVAHRPGLHTFRITKEGLRIFPRRLDAPDSAPRERPLHRVSSGVEALDEMLGGGVPAGDSMIVAGPSGSGKTTLCSQFIGEGGRIGEAGVVVVFEESPTDYVARADALGIGLSEMVRQGQLTILSPRSLDLSVDETLQQIRDAVAAIGARRVVFDSLSGFELALAPHFREDFRESFYRLMSSLASVGVTVLNTVEVVESFNELRFSPHTISALTDDVILQRYVEIDGQLRRVILVVKMRNSSHSKDLRLYEITGSGMQIGQRLKDYQGILTGVAEPFELGSNAR